MFWNEKGLVSDDADIFNDSTDSREIDNIVSGCQPQSGQCKTIVIMQYTQGRVRNLNVSIINNNK